MFSISTVLVVLPFFALNQQRAIKLMMEIAYYSLSLHFQYVFKTCTIVQEKKGYDRKMSCLAKKNSMYLLMDMDLQLFY
jgi:hypothetical protein